MVGRPFADTSGIWIVAMTLEQMIHRQYRYDVIAITPVMKGVGGHTYLVDTDNGRYFIKGVPINDEYVRNEPDITGFLRDNGICVAEYKPLKNGEYFWQENDILYFMQR